MVSLLAKISSLYPELIRQVWGIFKRRSLINFAILFALGLSFSLLVTACNSPDGSTSSTSSNTTPSVQVQTLRVGYQKGATVLNLLKTQGALEKRLKSQDISVEWSDFVAGPQMLEALNVGSIDFGLVGETPPIFAQAAGAPLVYVAYEPPSPAAEAILVQKNSPIRSVADLKGKTVALNKGSNVHYLLVRALESAGLKYSDIKPAYLPPGDARAAFEQGSVDAWVIWDPFLAAAEKSIGARILVDGKNLAKNRGFYLSTKAFSDQNPELLKILLEELQKVSDWAKSNPRDVAKFLNVQLGIDIPSLELAETRRSYGVEPINETVVADQQKIADTFFKLKLIPQEIKVVDSIWQSDR
ncbi:sulfonate ABC transporter substrate-binding protein [Phormidium tenue FACHB-886]|nr:sulfonate ABC transporter substrate-binding protein [Phormidium tenue FACHB-886]